MQYKIQQQEFHFDEGVMFFMASGQVLKIEVDKDTTIQQSGWMLLIHLDFFMEYSTGQKD